jgi:thiol:disulfide interchange protein DsbC
MIHPFYLKVFLMMYSNRTLVFFFCAALLTASPVAAFQKDGCGAGDCRDCHAVSKQEVAELLKGKVSEVLEVKRSQVPGLWDVEVLKNGKRIPFYLDFSKTYLISGRVIKLNGKKDENRLDLSRIPLHDAVIIGNPKAARKIIVFDDPECTFCRKLHPEMEKTVKDHPDIAFFIKMFPLAMHPQAKTKAKAILCASCRGDNGKAATLLSDALHGKKILGPDCEDDQVEKNIALAKELHISSTPTLIMPDGRVLPGYRKSDKIVQLLENK